MLNVQDEKFWTYADYCKLPEDGKRYEVIDGVVYLSPSPKSIHQALSKYLHFLPFDLEQAGHGWVFDAPFEVIMPGATPVQPDLIFVGAHQRQIMKMAPGSLSRGHQGNFLRNRERLVLFSKTPYRATNRP